MAIIAISRGAYSRGKEVAEKVAEAMGYRALSREVLLGASKDFNVPELKLTHTLDSSFSLLDRLNRDKGKYIAYIQASLLKHLKKDDIVYHGFACYFFVKDIESILNIRIVSEPADRIALLMESHRLGRREASRLLKKIDETRRKWGLGMYGIDPGNPDLYDLVIRLKGITVDDAVDIISRTARLPRFRTTTASMRELENLALAAEVNAFLIDTKPQVDVCIDNGFVSIITKDPVPDESDLMRAIGEIAKNIPGINGIEITTSRDKADAYTCLPTPETKSMLSGSHLDL